MLKIAIIGCGNMGIAYAKSFLKYEITNRENLILIEKNHEQAKKLDSLNMGIVYSKVDKFTIQPAEVVILAIKPQDFKDLAAQLKNAIQSNQLILSIMAGITIPKIMSLVSHPYIVRAMPNTPAQVGMGVTAYVASSQTSMSHIRMVEKLLSTTGREILVEDESILDVVTAVSGSGPAYFYYFVKAMIEGAKKMGLDEAMASLLVKQTMIGSYHLMNNSDKNLDELILSVKSRGGTTEAALNQFEKNNFFDIVVNALFAAKNRAQELSKII